MRCDNLIPGIVAECHWVVKSRKLVYSSTFGHVPTCVYMSHRPNEPSFPSSRGSSMCPPYKIGGKISDKNPEQWINIKFCVQIVKSASETLAVLTVAYGEYAMKK